MILKYLLIPIMVLVFSGCSWCETTVYVPEPYPVVTSCEVPYSPCLLHGNETEIILQMRECVMTLRKDAKVCQK